MHTTTNPRVSAVVRSEADLPFDPRHPTYPSRALFRAYSDSQKTFARSVRNKGLGLVDREGCPAAVLEGLETVRWPHQLIGCIKYDVDGALTAYVEG